MSLSTSSSTPSRLPDVLGAGAVVGQEDDQRVVELAGLARARRGCGRCPGPSGRSAPRTPPCSAASRRGARLAVHGGCVGSRSVSCQCRSSDALLDQPLPAAPRAARPSRRRSGPCTSRCPRRARAAASAARCRRRTGRTACPVFVALVLVDEGDGLVADRVGVEQAGSCSASCSMLSLPRVSVFGP